MNPVLSLELFTIISMCFVVGALVLTHKFVSPDYRKFCFLISVTLCLAIHYSDFLIDIFKGESYEIPGNLFLPEWPCNVMMWIALISSVLMFFKPSKVSEYLLYILFWVGTVCSVVGIAANFNFLGDPDFKKWDILKGLLSHVFLTYCCVYPFVEKMVKYNFFKVTLSLVICSALFILCGNYSRLILKILGRDTSGTMLDPPFETMPWLNLYAIMGVSLILWLIAITIYEVVRYEKSERWYKRINNFKNEI